MSLTPAETRVCDMIRRGLTTKEIANIQSISASTVSRHREHIRRKLGLTNKEVNLTTYLNTFMSDRAQKPGYPGMGVYEKTPSRSVSPDPSRTHY